MSGALRWLGVVALGLVVLPATPMCALPRVRASGPAVAQLSTGPLCTEVAHDVRVSAEKVEFSGGGDCRFGGATAYPKARGVWRDDERGGTLVLDEPVVVHAYTRPDAIENPGNLARLAAFCREMGRETNQGEIGVVIADEYFAIRNYDEEKP